MWPAAARNGLPRTMEEINNIVLHLNKLSRDERMGILGYSPLMDYPDFDYIEGSPCEYLHHLCLGVSKRLVELTFQVINLNNVIFI